MYSPTKTMNGDGYIENNTKLSYMHGVNDRSIATGTFVEPNVRFTFGC
jgi:hypothetical protein